jgi:energy-coupling factor transporter ATP-binding protein EcfA2
MDSKLPEILEFADIGDFVYQPLKVYSSGMSARLAFSCAINVEQDILIVDEVLAVGDARFVLKCWKKLEEIKSRGGTILFVSHAIEQVRNLCTKAILLDSGQLVYAGDTKIACTKYHDLLFPSASNRDLEPDVNLLVSKSNGSEVSNLSDQFVYQISKELLSSAKVFGIGGAKINDIKIFGLDKPNIFHGGELIRVEVCYSWVVDEIFAHQIEHNLMSDLGLGIALADSKGAYIFGCNNFDYGISVDFKDKTKTTAIFEFTMPQLRSGSYFFTFSIPLGTQQHHIQTCWYDYLIQLECITKLKNVYGVMHLSYEMDFID